VSMEHLKNTVMQQQISQLNAYCTHHVIPYETHSERVSFVQLHSISPFHSFISDELNNSFHKAAGSVYTSMEIGH